MIRVYCDFDGTITTQDIGNALFRRYAGDRAVQIVQRYLSGEITAPECFVAECDAVENLTRAELESFVDHFVPDPSFHSFVQFCAANQIPLTIVSDGFDVYVERFLKNHGLDQLPFYSNQLEFLEEGRRTRIRPVFPYTDSECPRCANCKRNHLLRLSGDDDLIVYIGDGYSDRCPARYADVVFAKQELIPYCQSQNITYHEFRTFADVQSLLEELVKKKGVKQRREAKMARRDVFLQG
ncbi:MAG TPA: MtnX-like HAD-IB family phosphatase [Bacteroidota bacterium]|nr:MtnX-like HAD-IB family phosphatase [Bacteroidota bacterium]